MRISIELGLHHERPNISADADRCRRVFWESYLLDRLSSSTLGRPFAIQDGSIAARIPDCDLPAAEFLSSQPQSPFHWRIGLNLLKSRTRRALNARDHGCAPSSSSLDEDLRVGRNVSMLRRFHAQLLDWRAKAPVSEPPRSLYETQEYYELSCQEARLHLLRAIIDKLPPGTRAPPDGLLRQCFQSARAIITSFESLRRDGRITYTRAYTHLIFVASLVVAYFINIQADHPGTRQDDGEGQAAPETGVGWWLSDLADPALGPGSESLSPWDTLSTAGNILSWFAANMPDVEVYTGFFHDLKRGIERSCHRSNPQDGVQQESFVAAGMAETVANVPNDSSAAGGMGFEDGHAPAFGEPWGSFDAAYQPLPGDVGLDLGEVEWPFSDMLGMEGVGGDMSGFAWDAAICWQESPSISMDRDSYSQGTGTL